MPSAGNAPVNSGTQMRVARRVLGFTTVVHEGSAPRGVAESSNECWVACGVQAESRNVLSRAVR